MKNIISFFFISSISSFWSNHLYSQGNHADYFQFEYFHQAGQVNHEFAALGYTKYFNFAGNITIDYHFAVGWDAKNGGLYAHTPAATVIGFMLLDQSPGIGFSNIGILLGAIPEGIGIWVGKDKTSHLGFNIAPADLYAGYGALGSNIAYIPNLSFQQIIFEDELFGSLIGYSSLGYTYHQKFAPENACFRVGIGYQNKSRSKSTHAY
jgi:hypothetical protein